MSETCHGTAIYRPHGIGILQGVTTAALLWVRAIAHRLVRLDNALALQQRLAHLTDPADYAATALRCLDVTAIELGMANIARQGAAIFVCNHPFGGIDGLLAIAAITAVRSDLRVLASEQLCRLPQLRRLIFPLDARNRHQATLRNGRSIRQALRWVCDGGALLIFPAGVVSRLRLPRLTVADRPWPAAIGRLVRLSAAPVIPLHIEGRNSLPFLLASLPWYGFGTPLLVRELFNKRGQRITVHIGKPRPAARLAALRDDGERMAYLRLKSDLLPALHVASIERITAPRSIAIGPDPDRLALELERIDESSILARSRQFSVYCLRASQAPTVMHEVARQREVTFRAVGEGTGNEIDLDLFDHLYDQLVLWDHQQRVVAGGYRLCRIGDIRRRHGSRGLYTHSLFEYQEPFFRLLGPAIELGRSFIAPAYQRAVSPLSLLWRAIGEYVSRRPDHCRLIGPVSISNAYEPASRELLVEFLQASCLDPMLSRFIRPRQPLPRSSRLRHLDRATLRALNLAGISNVLSEHEPDAKGVPVLLRQYLRMGGRILGFNVDPNFSNALDCLLCVDLRRTDPILLQRHFSPLAWARLQEVRVRRNMGSRSQGVR